MNTEESMTATPAPQRESALDDILDSPDHFTVTCDAELSSGKKPCDCGRAEIIAAARAELAALRSLLDVKQYGPGNGPAYFLEGDSAVRILDGDGHDLCTAASPEIAQELLVVLNNYRAMVAATAKG